MADAKQGKGPEDVYNGSSQSRVVLAKPRLGGFGSSSFASSSNKTSNPFGSVLRPSQLKPTLNPFLKPDSTDDNSKEKSEDRLKEKDKDEKDKEDVPKFVPLGTNDTRTGNQVPPPAQPTSSTSSASFVFGQNLSARVVMGNVNNGETNNGDTSADHSSSNGTSAELLFTSAAASAVKENNQEESSTEAQQGVGLAAAAAEYERSHARPPPPAATLSLTGEEGETNVLQITCRLFAWESGSWRERGRGMLRLNDAAVGGGARLVARVAGTQRVVLNTKLWPDMVAERAGTKSLRITAADAPQQVKLFLIMGAPQDITQLHRALTTRIAVSKRLAPAAACPNDANAQRAAERLEADFPDSADPDKTEEDHLRQSTQEEYESNVDGMKEDPKTLKRKEPAEDQTSPKRQCPDTKE